MFVGLRLSGGYTFLDSEVIRSTSSSPIFAAGRALYRRPRHSGSMQATYSHGRVAVGLGGVFVGSRVDTDFNFPTISSNAGYGVWHANGEVQLQRRTAVFVIFENLADRDYMEPLGYRGLGRTFRAGIRDEILMPRPMAAISWSGGKDSCAAYHRARTDFDIVAAVTMFNEDGSRSRSHGLRPEIVAAQAERLGLQSLTEQCTWQTYDDAFDRALGRAEDLGITHVVFGDILFDEHRAWAERLASGRGLTAVEPLWKLSTTELYHEFVASGTRARIVTVRSAHLDDSFLGRDLADVTARRARRARGRSVRRTRRVSHRRDLVPGLLASLACAGRWACGQQRLRRRRPGAR